MDTVELSIALLALYEAIPIWEGRLNNLGSEQQEEYELLNYQIQESKKLFTRLKSLVPKEEDIKPHKPNWKNEQ